MNNKQPKSLKEITPVNEFHRNKFSVRNENIKLYEDKDLKQAAIERVRYYYRKRIDCKRKYGTLRPFACDIYRIKAEAIMEFFNLTEDDLR